MANEITVNSSLRISLGSLDYQSRPTAFKATLLNDAPPAPGRVNCVANVVKVVDLSTMVNPGVCRIQNLGDQANLSTYVDVGMYDSVSAVFTPMLELLVGESYVMRLSRNLGEADSVPAPTGTSVSTRAQLALLSLGYNINVLVEAFDMD